MCLQTIPEVNSTDEFAQRVLGFVNGGAITLMISIGHRTGLFDTMAELAPSTSASIAEAAGLNERYVREWLGAMVTGGIVEYDARTAEYSLPATHAALLTRAATPNNMATLSQWISV